MSAPLGEKHGLSKLNEQAVREIRAGYLAYIRGYGYWAAKYGVNWATVRDVVQYATWPHVR